MRTPEEVRRAVATRWSARHHDWLSGTAHPDTWPISIPLQPPTEAHALRQPTALASWIGTWRGWTGPGTIEWGPRRWGILGLQTIPERLTIASVEEAAELLGHSVRWNKAVSRHARLAEQWPALAVGGTLARQFDFLADCPERDIERLEALLNWLSANPSSRLYPRQVPLAGIDGKWIERHSSIVTALWQALRHPIDDEWEVRETYPECLGLKRPPMMIKLRILDSALRSSFNGLRELTASIDELSAMPFAPRRALIVENLQNALALPDMLGTVVFMALGKSVPLLAKMPWLSEIAVDYWGDIDTHGFHILSQARIALPQVRSVMMDEVTLLSNRDLWGEEDTQFQAAELPNLTPSERDLYCGLKEHRMNVRLEQERIAWELAVDILEGWRSETSLPGHDLNASCGATGPAFAGK